VNGKEVSGGEGCNYRKGYLALESEGAPVEFRNLRIKELPSSHTPPALTAPEDTGLRTIFTGLDLRGWKTSLAALQRWAVRGERLHLASGSANPEATMWTENTFGDAEFVFDCRPAKPADGGIFTPPAIVVRGAVVRLVDASPGNYQRYSVKVEGGHIIVMRGNQESQRVAPPLDAKAREPFGLLDTGAGIEWMNFYAREL
jgi:hypothetical protein